MDGESGSYDILEAKLLQPGATPIFLPLKFLKVITHHFSDERVLGRGGYGVVYKGILQNGTVIAVKKLLETQLIQDKQFQNEVSYFMGIKHRNIVQFVGYCAVSEWQIVEFNGKYVFAELPERLLCFEFLSKGSLDKHLSGESCGLDWNMRYKIIKGICQGLHYLHSECHVIHLDLKPANILMDNNMTPKIADFGLSRLFGKEQTRVITVSRDGSLGYMSPEYLHDGIISTKSDIFSLGVMIIEIITGVRKYPKGTESPQYFIEKVLRSWRNRFERVPSGASLEIDCQEIKRCIEIGLSCLDTEPKKRPTTGDIVDIFNRSMDWCVRNDTLPSTDQAFARSYGKGKRKVLSPQDAALLIQMNYRAHLARRSQVHLARSYDKGKRKVLSPQDAALLIQMNYRAHLARRSQVLLAGSYGKGKRKVLSPQDAALLIQMNYRAHLARRSQVLRCLCELAVAKAKLKEIRSLFCNISYRRQIAHDSEERQRFSEKIIILLLTVDALEGHDCMLRAAQKSFLEELEGMLDIVDPQPPGKVVSEEQGV